MKKSIIYLGIALVTFTNVALAVDFQQSSENLDAPRSAKSEVQDFSVNPNEEGENPSLSVETVDFPVYKKTAEEIIAENNRIIEGDLSNEESTALNTIDHPEITIDQVPVCSEKSIEDRILQDSMVIESAVQVKPVSMGKCRKA